MANRRTIVAWAAGSVGLAALSIWPMLSHGWVPLDEGTIALSAEQVLHGALPHADFAHPYTGGLSFVHALAMRLFGVSLMTPRYVLFAAFVPWLAAVWWLVFRGAGVWWAGTATLLAAWWSLLVYPAAMPTYYLMFLGTWGMVALVRWTATSDRRWLVAAGAAAGAAIVIKQTGVYVLAGLLLTLLFLDQEMEKQEPASPNENPHTDRLIAASLWITAVLLVWLLRSRLASSGELLVLLLPVLVVLSAASSRERLLTRNPAIRRARLAREFSALLGGVAIVPALLALAYLFLRGPAGVGALVEETVFGGLRTSQSLNRTLPGAGTMLAAAWPILVIAAIEWRTRERKWTPWVFGAVGLTIAALAPSGFAGYLRVWHSAMLLAPIVVIGAVLTQRRAWNRRRRTDPFILGIAALVAFQGLNQFPYAAPNYFAYVAPLVFVALALVVARRRRPRRAMALAVMLLGFSGWMNRIGSVHTVGFGPVWWDDAHLLVPPRGRLRVTAPDSARYERLLSLIASHGGANALRAGPELPELYFLAAATRVPRNPFLLVPEGIADTSALATVFDTTATRVIVIREDPLFLSPPTARVRAWLAARYPNAARLDSIEVRWR